MSEMVERIARAMEPEAFDAGRFAMMADINTRAGDFERGQERARERARLALAAAREPTQAMLLAHELPDIGPDEIAECWRAMIDSALAEQSIHPSFVPGDAIDRSRV